jgi:hypothetical protein
MEMLDFEFLGKADEVTLRLEKAKKSVEAAKLELENSKAAYEELFAQAEQHGFSKPKLKKLTEDRVNALFEVMIADSKVDKNKKPKKTKEVVAKSKDDSSEENIIKDLESADEQPEEQAIYS